MWRGGYIGAPSLVCVAWCRTVGRPLGATGNPASRPVKPVTATGFPGRRAVAAAVHGGDGQRGGGGGRALREHLSCAIKKEGAHGLTNRALLHWVSLLSDWVSSLHRAATTNYLCCGQALEDSKGAGRAALTRLFLGAKIGFPDETGKPMAEKVCLFMLFLVPCGAVVCSIRAHGGGV